MVAEGGTFFSLVADETLHRISDVSLSSLQNRWSVYKLRRIFKSKNRSFCHESVNHDVALSFTYELIAFPAKTVANVEYHHSESEKTSA